MKFLIILEPTSTGFSAYSPDLLGCVAAGESAALCEANMQEAISFHLDGLREDGEPIPTPQSMPAFVEVAA